MPAKLALELAMKKSSGFPVLVIKHCFPQPSASSVWMPYLGSGYLFFQIVCCLLNFFPQMLMKTSIFPFVLALMGELMPSIFHIFPNLHQCSFFVLHVDLPGRSPRSSAVWYVSSCSVVWVNIASVCNQPYANMAEVKAVFIIDFQMLTRGHCIQTCLKEFFCFVTEGFACNTRKDIKLIPFCLSSLQSHKWWFKHFDWGSGIRCGSVKKVGIKGLVSGEWSLGIYIYIYIFWK